MGEKGYKIPRRGRCSLGRGGVGPLVGKAFNRRAFAVIRGLLRRLVRRLAGNLGAQIEARAEAALYSRMPNNTSGNNHNAHRPWDARGKHRKNG